MKNTSYYLFVLTTILSTTLQAQSGKKVAIVVFDRVQIIDYTGPYETFGQAGYQVYTVAKDTQAIITNMNMKVLPAYSFSQAPVPDIIVLPGGGVPHNVPTDHPVVQWMMQSETDIQYILSVCNGTFFLGPTKWLEGQKATTNAGMIDHLPHFIKGVKPVYDKRYVHSGKIITAGGLTAGIDAALYIVQLLESKAFAVEVANKMEYNWIGNEHYVRTQLADFLLSKLLDFGPPLRRKTLVYEGNENHWQIEYQVRRNRTLEAFNAEIMRLINENAWSVIDSAQTNDQLKTTLKVKDHNQQDWKCIISLKKEKEQSFYLTYRIEQI